MQSLPTMELSGSPQFVIVDAQGRLTSEREIAEAALKRSNIIGTPVALQVFALIDAIYMDDPRLDALRTWHQ